MPANTKQMIAAIDRDRATVIPEDDDARVFRNLERMMLKTNARLVGPEGQETEIPSKMYTMMLTFANLLAKNKAVLVTAMDKDLTTQEAALFLGVTRPTVVTLLERGEIPFTRVGKHRRIALNDLAQYREQRYNERRRLLDEFTQLTEELGGYDVSPEDLKRFGAA